MLPSQYYELRGLEKMQGQMTTTIITFVLIILIFYFLIIRPQKKRDKETKAMLAAMKKGDRVVTIGGIHGTIITVKDQTVVVKVDDSARIEFSKSAISTVVNKDAAKTAPKKAEKAEAKIEDKTEEKGGEAGSIGVKTDAAPAEENTDKKDE